jgi:hypothetical protein
LSPEEIHEAYISTNFIILKNDLFSDDVILNIGFVHELNPNIKSWAFITAWNPLPSILTYEENVLRNNSLLLDLNNGRYICHLGKGVSADGKWEEESFFIENISKATSLEISIKYGQMAFVYGKSDGLAELVYTFNQ